MFVNHLPLDNNFVVRNGLATAFNQFKWKTFGVTLLKPLDFQTLIGSKNLFYGNCEITAPTAVKNLCLIIQLIVDNILLHR
jgi:hypothetical protein